MNFSIKKLDAEIIRQGENGCCFNCWIRSENLQSADLQYADLQSADLQSANLQYANLRSADLRYANLQSADLQSANLQYANLRSADLRYANLQSADLQSADLQSANLRSADLCAPTVILLSRWCQVSDELCADLMEFDAYCHDDRAAFDKWVKTGACPYSDRKYQRVANFAENKNLWGRGKLCSPLNLMKRLIAEKCKDSDFHKEFAKAGAGVEL